MAAGTPSAAAAAAGTAARCIVVAAVVVGDACCAGAGEDMRCRLGQGPAARTPVWVPGLGATGAVVARSRSARRLSARITRASVVGLCWALSTCDSGPKYYRLAINRQLGTYAPTSFALGRQPLGPWKSW